ncbi:MAG: TonB-dependent receptor plug domain-containing protein [Geobacteraceae bacterium]
MSNYPAFIMHSYSLKTSLLFLCFYLGLSSIPSTAIAQVDEEMQVLQLFYQDNDLVVSATRTEKSISQVAENIAIVTADDIKAMNAHTVADVLNTVNGLHLAGYTGPGSVSNLSIQGSATRHITVIVDGVIQNNLSESFTDVGSMRVQHIDRIEIIKGPGSSSWGSSLGGVINIITKSPDNSREFGGTISASFGSQSTGDYRGEVSGTVGTLAYYLTGGGLLSDGLQPHSMLQSGNLYSKFQWQPSDKSTLTLTLDYLNDSREFGEFPQFGISFFNRDNRYSSTLALQQDLTEELSLDLSFKTLQTKTEIKMSSYLSDEQLQNTRADESTFGGNARMTWIQQWQTLVFGSDFDFGRSDSNVYSSSSQRLDKWAFYVNDTMKFGRFSLTPGVRYDNTNTNGDFWSPSIGATCTIADATVIRGYVARGFSIPPLASTFGTGFFSMPNPSLKMERVWSYSAGFETAAIKHLWLKTSYFRHEISDALTSATLPGDFFMVVNAGKQRREGVEVEIKTTPVYSLSLSGGFTFVKAKDKTTGEIVKDVPRYAYDLGVQYDNDRIIKAHLKGRYVDWNASPGSEGKYDALIWDLNLSKGVILSEAVTAEIFFTAHNLFNGSQYQTSLFQNPRRWFEGGIRFAF